MDRRNLLKAMALLLGTSVSGTCSRALVWANVVDGTPLRPALDDAQLHKVATIAELIIPETDTPGAIAAGVPEFIQRIVTEWYTPEERGAFVIGLDDIDAESHARFGVPFLQLSNADRTAVLRAMESGKAATDRGHGRFFGQIKELTVLGYYTSEVGAQSELVYRPVPGAYDGDAHLAHGARQVTQ